MSNELTTVAPAAEVDLFRLGEVLAQSGYFQDARQAAQAIVKVMAGRELGFGPIASMTGIHIIQGRPAIGADLMAKAVKRSGRYNYRVTELTDEACSIEFLEKTAEAWQSIGTSRFTRQDATKAKTKNLDAFPRNMLFARAMSNGVKWFCPDALGLTTYTPEELDGIEAAPIQAPAQAVQVEPAISQTTFPEPTAGPREVKLRVRACSTCGTDVKISKFGHHHIHPPRVMGQCDASAIERNAALARKHKVNGTPAIVFEDGTRAPGAIPAAEIEKRLAALARS